MPSPRKNRRLPSIDDEIPFWEFIYENVRQNNSPEKVGPSLVNRYSARPEVEFSTSDLYESYTKAMCPSLYKTSIEPKKMLELYKQCKIKISPYVEEKLEARCCAVLRVDSDRYLINYTIEDEEDAEDGINDDHEHHEAEDRIDEPEGQETPNLQNHDVMENAMWEHLQREFKESLTAEKLGSLKFWKDMLKNSFGLPVTSAHQVVRIYYNNLVDNIWKQDLNTRIKLRVLQELEMKMTNEQVEWFSEKENFRVFTSPTGLILNWEEIGIPQPTARNLKNWVPRVRLRPKIEEPSPSKSPSSSPPPPHNLTVWAQPQDPTDSDDVDVKSEMKYTPKVYLKKIPFTEDDNIKAWAFISKKIKDKNVDDEDIKPKGLVFWDEFIKETKSPKNRVNWSSHYRKRMCFSLHEMPFEKDECMEMYKFLEIPIDVKTHKILERKHHISIKLNDRKFVRSWKNAEAEIDPNAETAPRRRSGLSNEPGPSSPQKQPMVVEEDSSETPQNQPIVVEEDSREVPSEVSVPRLRGRPKKIVNKEPILENKQKRGRPAKQKLNLQSNDGKKSVESSPRSRSVSTAQSSDNEYWRPIRPNQVANSMTAPVTRRRSGKFKKSKRRRSK